MAMAWWIWVAAGVLLIASEAFVGSFVVLWFGFGAVLAGLLTLLIPELHVGIQLLIAVLSGAVMMLLFRDRFVAKGNAVEDDLYTFSAGEGRLTIDAEGNVRVAARGTYWVVANPETIPASRRKDGSTVFIEGYENNMAVLRAEDVESQAGK